MTKEVFVPAAEITHWRNAVVVAYGASGIAFSTWVSRLPAIRDGLDLTPGTIGLLLLCMTAGSFLSVSASGLIVLRLGSKLTIRIGSIMVGFGLMLAGFGTSVLANPMAVAAGLAIIGLGTASWNTASNVEGAAVERAVQRHHAPAAPAPQPGHSGRSRAGRLGCRRRIPGFWHLAAVGLLVAGSVTTAAAWFRADITPVEGERPFKASGTDTFEDPSTGPIPIVRQTDAVPEQPLDNKRQIAQAWRDKRTLLLGVLVLGLALAEGAAGDWVALALADGHGQTDAAGAAGYGLFVTFMTIGLAGTAS